MSESAGKSDNPTLGTWAKQIKCAARKFDFDKIRACPNGLNHGPPTACTATPYGYAKPDTFWPERDFR